MKKPLQKFFLAPEGLRLKVRIKSRLVAALDYQPNFHEFGCYTNFCPAALVRVNTVVQLFIFNFKNMFLCIIELMQNNPEYSEIRGFIFISEIFLKALKNY